MEFVTWSAMWVAPTKSKHSKYSEKWFGGKNKTKQHKENQQLQLLRVDKSLLSLLSSLPLPKQTCQTWICLALGNRLMDGITRCPLLIIRWDTHFSDLHTDTCFQLCLLCLTAKFKDNCVIWCHPLSLCMFCLHKNSQHLFLKYGYTRERFSIFRQLHGRHNLLLTSRTY